MRKGGTKFVSVEDAIWQPGLAKTVQRYQHSVDKVKIRLNLAVCLGAFLMPEVRSFESTQ